MQFSNSHARTFIRLNSVVYIFFLLRGILCLAWNFLLSVQKRKAEIALNSFMMESEDGTMVFKWLVCQKIPLHIFHSLLWKKFSLCKPVVFFSFYIANMYGNLMILCSSRLFTFIKKGGITPFSLILPLFKKTQLFVVRIFWLFTSLCHSHLFSFLLKDAISFHSHPPGYPPGYPPTYTPSYLHGYLYVWLSDASLSDYISSFIKLSNADLQCEFIQTFYCDLK